MKFRITPLCLLLLLSCTTKAPRSFLTSQELAWLQARDNTVIIAPEEDYPPFSFINNKSQLSGISADYIHLLEKKLPLRFKYLPFANLTQQLEAVKTGQADMLCNLKETPERLEYLRFTQPYIEVPVVIITRKASQGLSTLASLQGHRVAVGRNYGIHEYLRTHHPGLTLSPQENDIQSLRKLSFDEVDAAVMDVASASYLIESESIVNLKITGNTPFRYILSMAIRNDLPILLDILDKGIAQISLKEREAITSKWIQLSYPLFWTRYLLLALAGLLAVILGIAGWNHALKQKVKQKTQALRTEMEDRLHAEAHLKAVLEGRTEAIWAIDKDYNITAINPFFKAAFQAQYDIVLEVGIPALNVLPERMNAFWKPLYDRALSGESFHHEFILSDQNAKRTFIVSLNPIRVNNKVTGASVISTDITESKNAADQIAQDLREKEVLLREIHHRVKNNMNIMTSLLNLQAAHVQSAEEAVAALEESRNRIMSMALVHHLLYQSNDFSRIDMNTYIKNITQELSSIMGGKLRLDMHMQLQGLSLDINTAIPCGLILNEWLTNTFKHAFPDSTQGKVYIAFSKQDNGLYQLDYKDTGVGLPDSIDFPAQETLGLRLISILSEQLSGHLSMNRNGGTAYSLTFPEPGHDADEDSP